MTNERMPASGRRQAGGRPRDDGRDSHDPLSVRTENLTQNNHVVTHKQTQS